MRELIESGMLRCAHCDDTATDLFAEEIPICGDCLENLYGTDEKPQP